jgi:predicted metalloenzyme YecM
MTQLIDDFHAKSKARAEELAKRLGVDFTPLDAHSIETKARRRMVAMQNYRERKEEYDALMDEVLTVLSPEEVVEILKNYQK